MSALIFSTIHIASKDLAASRAFFVDVLHGKPVEERESAFRVELGTIEVAVERRDGIGTPIAEEYPHYALTVTPEQFVGLKERLDSFGVPTNSPWTRAGRTHALLYFRDPSGNQFELFSPTGAGSLPLRVGARAGGDYVTDFTALAYRTLGAPSSAVLPDVRPTGFNHMTLPCRDLPEAKRFLVEVLGGHVSYEGKQHVTAVIGNAEIGAAPQAGGWTAPGARLPRYTFRADGAALRDLKARFEGFGVPIEENDASLFFRDPSGNLFELAKA